MKVIKETLGYFKPSRKFLAILAGLVAGFVLSFYAYNVVSAHLDIIEFALKNPTETREFMSAYNKAHQETTKTLFSSLKVQ